MMQKVPKIEVIISFRVSENKLIPFIKTMHQNKEILAWKNSKQLENNRIAQKNTKREAKYIQKV
jgi:hypothetical protein